MKIVKKLTAAAAAVCLAATTSCSAAIGQGTQNALSVDGYDIGAGMLVYYTIQAYDNAVSLLSDQNSDTPTVKDVKNSKLDEKDAVDWIQDKATDECITYAAVQKKFAEIGGELTADQKTEAHQIAEYYYNMDSRAEKNGVSLETFNKIAEASYEQDELFLHYYGIDAEKGCSEEDLKDYFDDNFARCKYIIISKTNSLGEAMSEDELRDIRKKAEDYARQINKKSGEMNRMWEMDECDQDYKDYIKSLNTTEAVEEEEVETVTTAAPEEATEAETTTTNPYANERLVQKPVETTAADGEEEDKEPDDYDKFIDYVFNELEPGKAEVYDYDKENLYVIIRGDLRERMTEDDYWTEDYKKNLLQLRYYNDYTDFIKSFASTLEVKKNDSAYRRYDPFSLDLEKQKNS